MLTLLWRHHQERADHLRELQESRP
jgi:hypothetical protein